MWTDTNKGMQDKHYTPTDPRTDKIVVESIKALIRAENPERLLFKVKEVTETFGSINWKEAALYLDRPEPLVRTQQEAAGYIEMWNVLSDGAVLPYKRFLKPWTNARTQVHTLICLLSLPPDTARLFLGGLTALIECEKEVEDRTEGIRELARSNYNCNELYVLAAGLDADLRLELLGHIQAHAPELLALGMLANISGHEKVFLDAFSNCLGRDEKSRVVLDRLFSSHPRGVLVAMSKMHPSVCTLEECFSACIRAKMLPKVLSELDPLDFSLDLVLLAVSKEIIDLGSILCPNSGEEFTNHFIQHLILRYGRGSTKGTQIYPLTVDIVISACVSLESFSKTLSKSTQSLLGKLKAILAPEIRTCIVKRMGMRQLASEFLHNVISGRTPGADAVVQVTQLSASKSAYDSELFEHIAVEMEHRYAYVERLGHHQTVSMALFYGRTVKYEVFNSDRTKKTVAAVVELLKQETGSNRFKFAIKALETFCDVLEKFPYYCQEVSRMPQVFAANKSLYAYIRGHLAIQGVSAKEEAEGGALLFSEYVSSLIRSPDVCARWDRVLRDMGSLSSLDIVAEIKKSGASEKDLAKYLVSKKMLSETRHIRAYAQFVTGYSPDLCFLVRQFLCFLLVEYPQRFRELEKAERVSSLRTIGTYLGMLTFADNAPLPKKFVCVKDHLISSVEKGHVYSAVAFTCKYVEECVSSRIFGCRSPYVQGILRVLSEIHFLADSSDLLSLEIELCFKNIGLRIEEVKPSSAVQERQLGARRKVHGLAMYTDMENIRNTHTHIITMGIDFAVRDITYAIVDKAFNICTHASVELLKRDFAACPERGAGALRHMLLALTVRLVVASAAGPIFSSTVNNVLHFLKLAGMEESISAEKINAVVEKNMGICTELVEHIVRQRIAPKIPGALDEYREAVAEHNRRHKKKKTVPESYNISLFERKKYVRPASILATEVLPVTVGEYHEICAYLASINYKNRENGEVLGPFTGSLAQKKWEEMQKALQEVEKAGAPVKTRHAIELRECIQGILSFVHSGAHDMACLFFCQNVIGSIFMLGNAWARGECIKMVQGICRLSYEAMQEVSSWLIYAEDERKFNPEIMAQMLDKEIINKTEYDIHLAGTLAKSPQKMRFAAELLRICLLSDVPIGTPFDFVCTIEAVSKHARGIPDEKIKTLLKSIAKRIFLTKRNTHDREVFDNWTDLTFYRVQGKEVDRHKSALLKMAAEKMKDRESYKTFLKTAFSAGVEYYLRLRKECSPVKYLKIEALGLLVSSVAKTKESLALNLGILTDIFIYGVEMKYYEIQMMFLRLLQVLLENLPNEQEEVAYLYLERIRPAALPSFTGGYVELLFSEYVMRNMFIRNPYRGLSILEWVYSVLHFTHPGPELEMLVYACSVFALRLRKYCPAFYTHYSYLLILCIPRTPEMALLRNAWSLERHATSLDILCQNTSRVRNTEYLNALMKVRDCIQGREEIEGLWKMPEDLVSCILADALTNQKDVSKDAYEAVLKIFGSPEAALLKEHLLARMLERCTVPQPHPLYLKKAFDTVINGQPYMESLSEIVRKDKQIIGRLIVHSTELLSAENLPVS